MAKKTKRTNKTDHVLGFLAPNLVCLLSPYF